MRHIDEHTGMCDSARQDPTGSNFALTAEPGVNFLIGKNMNIKNIIATAALFAAAGSAFAQQTEFVAPDAGFKSTLTRAEVRQDLAQAYAQGNVAQRQHDGQDTQFAAGTKSREEIRKEAARAAQTRHAGDVNDLYFGA